MAPDTAATEKAAFRAVESRRPWEWRLALNHGFWDRDGKPTFHAHDVDNLAACGDGFGLLVSIEEPNEGSYLCPDCMVIVRRQPQGRATTSTTGRSDDDRRE